jgi:hypothetical protein
MRPPPCQTPRGVNKFKRLGASHALCAAVYTFNHQSHSQEGAHVARRGNQTDPDVSQLTPRSRLFIHSFVNRIPRRATRSPSYFFSREQQFPGGRACCAPGKPNRPRCFAINAPLPTVYTFNHQSHSQASDTLALLFFLSRTAIPRRARMLRAG